MTGASPVESPCVDVCRLVPGTDLCEGCARTATEIACWLRYTPSERRAVMAALPARRAALDNEKLPGGDTDDL